MKNLIFLLLFFSGTHAFAAGMPLDDISVLSLINQAVIPASDKLLTTAIKWLAALVSIQFVITNIALLKKGSDLSEVFAKLLGSFAWIGFCGYVLTNAPQFIDGVGKHFFDMVGFAMPSPGGILTNTVALSATLTAIAAGVNYANSTVAMLIVYITLFLFAVGFYFAVKVFMLQLELALVVMLSPLSFAFLGLNALKDQGIAPFKALISLGYRIVLMTVILFAFSKVDTVVYETFKDISKLDLLDGVGPVINTVLAGIGAYLMLGFALYKSDAIAGALASGTTNMGPADVAQAAALGAAAGAAAATGGASLATAGATGKQAMGDWIASKMGGAGSISNASNQGLGPMPIGQPPQTQKLSVGGNSSLPPKRNSPAMPATEPDANTSASAAPASTPASASAPASAADTGGSGGSGGSAESAGINAPAPAMEKQLGDLVKALSKEGKPPGFNERISDANRKMEGERASTHVSINTHNSD